MAVSVCKSGNTWRLIYEGPEGKRNISKTSSEALSLGFRPDMNIEMARGVARRLAYSDREARARDRTQKRDVISSTFLRRGDVEDFEKSMSTWGVYEIHWRAAQKVIADMECHPSAWSDHLERLYASVQKRKWRPNYWKKLRRIMNLWGKFLCRRDNRYFSPLEAPPPRIRREMNSCATRRSGESAPLTEALLLHCKHSLPPANFQWLYVSFWLGLRPRECDNLRRPDARLWQLHEDRIDIFQEKLMERGIEDRRCWKTLYLKEPEHRDVVRFILSGELVRPTSHQLRSLVSPSHTAYAGRKGIVDVLRKRGYTIEACRDFLGHQTVVTTERYYERRGR